MQIRAKLTSKGQITLPITLRRRLGLAAGDTLVFETQGDRILISPQRQGSVFAEFRGSGTPGIPSGKEAVLAWVREQRGEL